MTERHATVTSTATHYDREADGIVTRLGIEGEPDYLTLTLPTTPRTGNPSVAAGLSTVLAGILSGQKDGTAPLGTDQTEQVRKAREEGRQQGLAEAQGGLQRIVYDEVAETYVALVSKAVATTRIPLGDDAVARLRKDALAQARQDLADLGLKYTEADMDDRGQTAYEDGVETGKAEAMAAVEYQREQEDRQREHQQDMTVEQHRRAQALHQARGVLEVRGASRSPLASGGTSLEGGLNGLMTAAEWIEKGTQDLEPQFGPVLAYGPVLHHTRDGGITNAEASRLDAEPDAVAPEGTPE